MRAVDNFELIRRFMHFESTDQFYFMQILQRKKDGPGPNGIVCGTNNKARAIKSYCITSVEMLDRISIEVKHLCEYFNARAYFYPARRSFKKVAMRNMVLLANNISESNYGHAKTDYWSACGTTEIEKLYLVDVDNDKCDKERVININVKKWTKLIKSDMAFISYVRHLTWLHSKKSTQTSMCTKAIQRYYIV